MGPEEEISQEEQQELLERLDGAMRREEDGRK